MKDLRIEETPAQKENQAPAPLNDPAIVVVSVSDLPYSDDPKWVTQLLPYDEQFRM